MGYKIITISRQCGSGGHSIGQALAEKLNIPLYDKKILEEVSRRSGLAEDVIEQEGLLFTGRYFRYRKYRMRVYRVQFWAIFMRSIAQNRYSSHTCEPMSVT